MASQTAATRMRDGAVPVPVHKECNHLKDRANDAVARRAYSFYLADGATDGQALQHWLRAESEVVTRVPDIRENSSGYTVNVPLQGFRPEQIQVDVSEKGAVIAAEKTEGGDRQPSGDWSSEESVFMLADWPRAVDPSSASAYVKSDGLTITVKRAESGSAAGR
jgi:HSP20 family molecular chaperone IbpA